jgi:hypothetical protein
MSNADYRRRAGECYRMAMLATQPADRATWLKLAAEWLAAEDHVSPLLVRPRAPSSGRPT